MLITTKYMYAGAADVGLSHQATSHHLHVLCTAGLVSEMVSGSSSGLKRAVGQR